MSVGHAPGEPMWTPDMRKDDAHITDADKAEAKRRIQGQVAEESPDDSASGPEGEDVVSASLGDRVKAKAGVPPMAAAMAG
jgi:phosphatidylserine decarboxylase